MQRGEWKNKKSPCCWHENINRHEPIENIVIPVLRQFESELERGALITIDPSRSRVRILPIIT
jgi:predicted nuclease of predicted toxin-antitoxin system